MVAVPFFLMLLQTNHLFAEAPKATDTSNTVSAGEILLYIALIVAIILIAWFFGAGQSKKSDEPSVHHQPHARRHFDHPNDPHFKKLKRKTS
ncbi:MAG TPA: hypothetical protein VL651_17155 [Bacteroidia bacterium]|jgi:hypothetical protein|nr:hypothetical protein [Bacteroidia bacterium]